MAYQTVKGTYDILPSEMRKYEQVNILFKHFLSLYGYELMETPVFEYTGVFKKENDTSDMVTKEMYTFAINNGDSLTLRPEGTAGIIRSFIQNKLYANELPVKLAYSEPMFRYERPQKGRQRQFNQLGIEVLGNKSPIIDAEAISLGYHFVKTLGLKSIKVCINTLGDSESRLKYKEALTNYFKQYEVELCEDCKNRLYKNPLRILDCKVDHEKDFILNAPKIEDYLSDESKQYFKRVLGYLDSLEIPYEIDSTLVRGLDYYTETVFEVKSTHSESGSQNTIFGGGRYDNLVSEMGGPEMSGFGFAIGLERLIILGESEGVFETEVPGIDAYIIDMTKSSSYVLKLATNLRNNGYTTELNTVERSMKSQFKSCDRKKARFILIVGEDELNSEMVMLKDTKDQSQGLVKYDEIIDEMDKKMGEDYE